jgi:predicted restriction endonuclease
MDNRQRKNARSRQHYKENREKRMQQLVAYERRLRQRVLDQYNRKCARCGWTDERALQLDHVNGNGEHERRTLTRKGILRRALKCPELYQLLCANHNWIKRYEDAAKVKVI